MTEVAHTGTPILYLGSSGLTEQGDFIKSIYTVYQQGVSKAELVSYFSHLFHQLRLVNAKDVPLSISGVNQGADYGEENSLDAQLVFRTKDLAHYRMEEGGVKEGETSFFN